MFGSNSLFCRCRNTKGKRQAIGPMLPTAFVMYQNPNLVNYHQILALQNFRSLLMLLHVKECQSITENWTV